MVLAKPGKPSPKLIPHEHGQSWDEEPKPETNPKICYTYLATRSYMLFLGRWARKLSWKETAEAFRISWKKVFDAVEYVVNFGLEHRVLGQIDAIGVDEIQYIKGHKYPMLVYQIDVAVTRLLWVGRERIIEAFCKWEGFA
jgi:transposase